MPEKPCFVIASYHAPAERHQQIKRVSLGSWFENLRRNGLLTVPPEALEGRTGCLQSSPSAALRINSAKDLPRVAYLGETLRQAQGDTLGPTFEAKLEATGEWKRLANHRSIPMT